MRRYFGFAGLFLAACSGGSSQNPQSEPTVERRMEVDPKTGEPIHTQELGTDRLRPAAKTLEWSQRSTPENAVYAGGNLVIDKIFREDADDFFGVRVRLGNRTTQAMKIEFRILFFDRDATPLVGIHDDYRSAIVEPREATEIGDACRVRGATDFQLLVRLAGMKDVGLPTLK